MDKESKRNQDQEKESRFLKFLRDYFLQVAPLNPEEALALQEVLQTHHPQVVAQAIRGVAASNDRSFSYFLKVLDGLAGGVRRVAAFGNLSSSLERYRERFPRA